ncbi:MAG: adenosylcobinamide amidohydrolase [Syntrophobacterales bacterium]|nr:adenosylcobinamide amidohydrolase [Syntrophobacterales bacterium]
MNSRSNPIGCLNILILVLLAHLAIGGSLPVYAKESTPCRVVSLVPSATEILKHLKEDEKIVGITLHDRLPTTEDRKIVGSFFRPILTVIKSLNPDTIIIAPVHQREIKNYLPHIRTITVEMDSIERLFQNIRTLGYIFNRQREAEDLIAKIYFEIELIKEKLSKIPNLRPLRVMRFMGRYDSETIMVPGDNSFQNEIIRLSGGMPSLLGKKGEVVSISLEEWKTFDPEFIYGCGEDRQIAEKFFSLPGWKEVTAVREGRIAFFPCDLTCRISPYTGKFIQWLASTLYGQYFGDKSNWVLSSGIKERKPIPIYLNYVASAELVKSTMMDFQNKTLLIRFNEPLDVLSTLDGPRSKQTTIGNHSSPPPLWNIGHQLSLSSWRQLVKETLGLIPSETTLLFTGADMDNLSVQVKIHGDLVVYALITAGAESNALRTSKDEGSWEESGTINIILMTNRQLSHRAMTRAIITATEAKTAALQDLDIRSSYNGPRWQATGTGTDEIIVVSGKGKASDNTGGHSRLGEVIAKAVYDGVKEALQKQNGFYETRSIFRRLQERRIELYSLIPKNLRSEALPKIEKLLLEPRYKAFMETALLLSDAMESKNIGNLSAFRDLARLVAKEIARKYGHARTSFRWKDIAVTRGNYVPEPIIIALNAMLNGIYP